MFQVGQEVECIRDVTLYLKEHQEQFGHMRLPKKGEKFIVRWCGISEHNQLPSDEAAVMLVEILLPKHPHFKEEYTFSERYFRAIIKTDISALVKLCNPIPMKLLEPI